MKKMNISTSILTNLKESIDERDLYYKAEDMNLIEYIYGLEDLPIKNTDIDTLKLHICSHLNKYLTHKDKEDMINYGGFTVKDYIEGEPVEENTDVHNSSFSTIETIPISVTAYWNTDNGKKEVPLKFNIQEIAYSYSGGWN